MKYRPFRNNDSYLNREKRRKLLKKAQNLLLHFPMRNVMLLGLPKCWHRINKVRKRFPISRVLSASTMTPETQRWYWPISIAKPVKKKNRRNLLRQRFVIPPLRLAI